MAALPLDADADEIAAALTELVARACDEVLPRAMTEAIMRVPKDAVRPARRCGAHDYECRAPGSAFLRLRRGRGDAAVEWVTTSDLGLERRWRFESAEALAQAIADRLEIGAAAGVGSTLAHVRAAPDGRLQLTTIAQMASQRARGWLHCAACGRFLNGERGLRDHQLVAHAATYEHALDSVEQSRSQLVRYAPLLLHARAADGAAAAGGKAGGPAALDPGLCAARDGDLAALMALRAAGWDPRAVADRHGSTALLWAAGGGHLDVCRWLVRACGVDAAERQKRDGRCALHWAARNGRVAVCRWLVDEQRLDPDTPTRDGTVALHWAVWQRQLPAVEYLVAEAGANLHAVNAFGCNAIQWAAQSGDVRMCEWLRARGLDVRLLNRNGHSALHKAAIKGQRAVCEWLVQVAGLGAAQVRADADGNTPARMARCEGHAELADWLADAARRLTSGPDPDCHNDYSGNRGRCQ